MLALVSLLIAAAWSACSAYCGNDTVPQASTDVDDVCSTSMLQVGLHHVSAVQQSGVRLISGHGHASTAPLPPGPAPQTCPLEQLNYNVVSTVQSCRLAVVLFMFTAVNLVSQQVQSRISANPFAKHIDSERMGHIISSHTRIWCVPLLVAGYVFALYQHLSGCSLAGIYVYTCAFWGGIIDGWELVRRWPLTGALTLHHLGVIGLVVGIADFELFAAGGALDIKLLIIFANVGLQWTGDRAVNAAFIAYDVASMKLAIRVALLSAAPRIVNMFLLAWMAAANAWAQRWPELVLSGPLAVGYVWANCVVIRWAFLFDPDKYFAEHQQLWLAAESGTRWPASTTSPPEQASIERRET